MPPSIRSLHFHPGDETLRQQVGLKRNELVAKRFCQGCFSGARRPVQKDNPPFAFFPDLRPMQRRENMG